MPKADVSMSEGEVLAFLVPRRTCVLAARTAAGEILPALGRTVLEGGSLHVSLSADDPAVAALRDDGRVCCLIEESPAYFEIVSVAVRGVAKGLHPDGERVGFELAVDDVVSSSFAKLKS